MSNIAKRLTVLIAVLGFAGFFSGCSTVHFYASSQEELARELMGPSGNLKKQVIMAGFQNISGVRDLDLNKLVSAPVKAYVGQECKRIIIQNSPRIEYLIAEHFGPSTGISRNLEAMAQARATGAYAVVTGSLWKVAQEKKKQGIYGFRDTASVIKVGIDLWVYDPLTGAKLADARIFSEFAPNQDADIGAMDWRGPVFAEFVEQIGKEVCKALEKAPWRGFVTSANNNTLTIASGKETGILAGMLLWVYADGQIVDGVNGEQFMVPGKKIAKAKVSEVFSSHCLAVLTEDADISAATWVTLRKKGDKANPF